MQVTLTSSQMIQAGMVGVCRQVASIQRGLQDRHGANPEDGFRIHFDGALGECAFAKATGMYWPGTVNAPKGQPDVGEYHVRTRSKDHYDLPIRDDDPDGKYVLVTGVAPTYTIHGWAYAQDFRQPRYRKDPNGRGEAWWIPQRELRTDFVPVQSGAPGSGNSDRRGGSSVSEPTGVELRGEPQNAGT